LEAKWTIIYLSEKEVSNPPSQNSLLQVPIPIDGMVALSSKVFVDEGRFISKDVFDLNSSK
jgi:hypothetical protein